jgi:hypothetical protein
MPCGFLLRSSAITARRSEPISGSAVAGNLRLHRVYVPDNRYQYGDVFIVMLKGASDFPSWNVTSNGQWIIDRYAPGLSFVSGADADPPPDNSTLIWYKSSMLKNIPERYPRLAEAIAKSQKSSFAMSIPVSDSVPSPKIVGHRSAPVAGQNRVQWSNYRVKNWEFLAVSGFERIQRKIGRVGRPRELTTGELLRWPIRAQLGTSGWVALRQYGWHRLGGQQGADGFRSLGDCVCNVKSLRDDTSAASRPRLKSCPERRRVIAGAS